MHIRVEDNNLLNYSDWLTGNTSIYNGTFIATNFGTVTQIVEYDDDPFGNTGIVWTHKTISAASRNGFNTAIVDVDNNYNYRYSCWIKSSGITSAYFRLYGRLNGTISGLTNITTGTLNQDSNCFAQVPYNYSDDKWYLWVGHVRSYTTTGTTSLTDSGLYSTDGTKLISFTDWKFLNNTNTTSYRLYIPYNTSGTTVQFVYPRIDKCDGTEPSIATLLQNEGMWRSGTTYIKVEDKNLLDYSDWSTDLSGSTSEFTAVTEYNAQLNQYRQLDTDPFGNTNYIWVASGVTVTGATYGGGYISSGVTIDNTKTYRISQWCNRFNSGDTSNEYYFGFRTYDINGVLTGTTRNDGVYNTNYYVYGKSGGYMASYNINGWFLTVGYILPYTSSGVNTTYQGKIYYNNGLVNTYPYNFYFNVNAKYLATRSYSPYNTTSFAGTKFCYPRIDLVDGTEPSINTLLTNEGMWRSGTTMIYVDDGWKNT